MSALYQWVGSILCFLIFVTMVQALLPSKKYEKYLRFFAGMVLILLVIQPLTGSLRVEDQMAYYFEAISFQKESQDLSKEILGIEKQRLEQVIASYEQAVEMDVKLMAEDAGFSPEAVQVDIDGDQESDTYGMVTHVKLTVRNHKGEVSGEENEQEAKDNHEEILVDIPTVEVVIKGGETQGGQAADEAEAAGSVQDSISNEEVGKLRRKVEQYYGLESNKVEIEYKVR